MRVLIAVTAILVTISSDLAVAQSQSEANSNSLLEGNAAYRRLEIRCSWSTPGTSGRRIYRRQNVFLWLHGINAAVVVGIPADAQLNVHPWGSRLSYSASGLDAAASYSSCAKWRYIHRREWGGPHSSVETF